MTVIIESEKSIAPATVRAVLCLRVVLCLGPVVQGAAEAHVKRGDRIVRHKEEVGGENYGFIGGNHNKTTDLLYG